MNKKEFLGASLHTGLKFDIKSDLYPYPALVGIRKDYLEFNYCGVYLSFQKDFVGVPIVRPLSDLTKPITHNGETFVPIAKLFKMPDSEVDIVSASEECVQFINKRTRCHYSFYVATIRLTEALMLIEWHFNLMDESEPFIPVTDEFNPYK